MTDQSWPARDDDGGLPEHEVDRERTSGANEPGEQRQFPPPVVDLAEATLGTDPEDLPDDEDLPDAVPPGPTATRT
jgi:hypothetical protein